MTATVPVRETREVLLARAQDAMRLAALEPLAHRAQIHLEAAERWRKLADRKLTGRLKMRDGSAVGDDEDPAADQIKA